MMKWILRLNGMLEALAGMVLLFKPDVLLMAEKPGADTLSLAKLYGILAFFFGIISLILAAGEEQTLVIRRIVLAIISFHLCVGLYMHGLYEQHITPHAGAAILHIAVAIAFLAMYMKEKNKLEGI